MEHVVELGFGTDELAKKHAIWMLVRMKYTIHRPIRGGEVLRIKTWGRRPTGAFVIRDYELYVGQERVGEAVSTWVLGDMENHSLLRAEDLLSPEGALEMDHPQEKLGKIRMPKEMEEVASAGSVTAKRISTATPTIRAMPITPVMRSGLKLWQDTM